MSNPVLTTTNSKLDTRVKEPSGVVPSPTGPGSSDRVSSIFCYQLSYLKIMTSKNTYEQICLQIFKKLLTLNYIL